LCFLKIINKRKNNLIIIKNKNTYVLIGKIVNDVKFYKIMQQQSSFELRVGDDPT